MTVKPTFGVVLPSQRLPGEATRDLVSDLRNAAEAAAGAGAETIWVWDHMLKAPTYQGSWHDPFVALAAVTDFGVRLGTAVLVAPVRPPVQTAMAVASLQQLTKHPMRLGVGTGWNPVEFAAAGVELRHRGALTDEFIAVVESIFAGEREFEGRFCSYSGLEVGHLGPAPEIWIAGGSRLGGGGNLGPREKLVTATIAPAVAKRILKQGRWVLRPTAEFSDYQNDLAALADVLGDVRAVDRVQRSLMGVTHIVETDDPVRAREEQHRVFAENLVSTKRPPDYVEAHYMVGSLPEIRSRLEQWCASGLEHVGLSLLGDVPSQVALAQRHFGDLWSSRDADA